MLQLSESLIVREPKSGTFLRPPDLEGKFSPGDLTSWNPPDSATVGLRKHSSGLFKNGGLYSVWSVATASSKIKDDCQIKDISYSLHLAERFMLWKYHLVSFLLSFSQSNNALSIGVKTWGKHLKTLYLGNREMLSRLGMYFSEEHSSGSQYQDTGPLKTCCHYRFRHIK